jgi:hypothetical protein
MVLWHFAVTHEFFRAALDALSGSVKKMTRKKAVRTHRGAVRRTAIIFSEFIIAPPSRFASDFFPQDFRKSLFFCQAPFFAMFVVQKIMSPAELPSLAALFAVVVRHAGQKNGDGIPEGA